jgi:anti-sigma regulatory factor (Ser/Thr protein kinase)
MVAVAATDQSFLLRFDSDITFVDYAVSMVDGMLSYWGLDDRTDLLIVCRELFKNAVVHGNRNDSAKSVTLRLRRFPDGSCTVESEDDGPGFDVDAGAEAAAAAHPLSERSRPSGFTLIRALAGRIEFNERGNRVTVLLDPAATMG